MSELTDAAAQDLWERSRGPLPYQTREQPKTIVRNLTHTTVIRIYSVEYRLRSIKPGQKNRATRFGLRGL